VRLRQSIVSECSMVRARFVRTLTPEGTVTSSTKALTRFSPWSSTWTDLPLERSLRGTGPAHRHRAGMTDLTDRLVHQKGHGKEYALGREVFARCCCRVDLGGLPSRTASRSTRPTARRLPFRRRAASPFAVNSLTCVVRRSQGPANGSNEPRPPARASGPRASAPFEC
jgi:hypothetical protein